MTKDEALIKIATVNAMDYEYQAWAREALANDTSQERVDEIEKQRHDAQPQRTWVEIDDDDWINALEMADFDKAAAFEFFESKLKELNT